MVDGAELTPPLQSLSAEIGAVSRDHALLAEKREASFERGDDFFCPLPAFFFGRYTFPRCVWCVEVRVHMYVNRGSGLWSPVENTVRCTPRVRDKG